MRTSVDMLAERGRQHNRPPRNNPNRMRDPFGNR
jgi:hypothetical protein